MADDALTVPRTRKGSVGSPPKSNTVEEDNLAQRTSSAPEARDALAKVLTGPRSKSSDDVTTMGMVGDFHSRSVLTSRLAGDVYIASRAVSHSSGSGSDPDVFVREGTPLSKAPSSQAPLQKVLPLEDLPSEAPLYKAIPPEDAEEEDVNLVRINNPHYHPATSSCSSCISSPSSTYVYHQEDFETYQIKVLNLCKELGFGAPVNIQRMNGGSYNRVIGLTFPASQSFQNVILRIPRSETDHEDSEIIRDQVSVLRYLNGIDFLCAPTPIAVDTTNNNALGRQFSMQQRMPGQSLEDGYYQMPLSEKLAITKVVAEDLLIKMEGVVFDKPGQLAAGHLAGSQTLPWKSAKIPLEHPPVQINDFPVDYFGPHLPNPSIASLIIDMFHEKFHGREHPNFVRRYEKLISITGEMNEAGLLPDASSKNVLWHWDLCARHLFIDKVGSQWKVTGTIDWDGAYSVPLVLARKPHYWLWYDEDEREKGSPAWSGNRDTPLNRELNHEEAQIKQFFDAIMSNHDPNYMEDTYGRGLWARKLFRFALDGLSDARDFYRFDVFCPEWDRHYKQIRDSMNDAHQSSSSGSLDSPPSSISSASKSASNHSMVSKTSTEAYGYETFETYQHKVIQLCKNLGFGEPSKVDRMAGGAFNRVIGLTLESHELKDLVLRVPHLFKDDRFAFKLRDQVAILQYLGQFEFIQTPKVVAIDTTSNNVLECPFSILQRVSGTSLGDIYYQLPLTEKLAVTKTVARTLIQMEKIVLPRPGSLVGTEPLPCVSATSSSTFASCTNLDITGFPLNLRNFGRSPTQQALPSLIGELLDIQHDHIGHEPGFFQEMFQKLRTILNGMEQAGFFRPHDVDNVLWHWDLCARHIFVEKAEVPDHVHHDSGSLLSCDYRETIESQWKVTGIIDWDEALSVPLVLARKPPTWLWFNENERGQSHRGDSDSLVNRELTDEEAQIKRLFDQTMTENDPTYMDDAYGRGIWLRRLARFGTRIFMNNSDFDDVDVLFEEWTEYMARNGSRRQDGVVDLKDAMDVTTREGSG